MEKFASTDLRLVKSVKKGNKESLLSLFSVTERYKHMKVLMNADEGASIRVALEGLAEADLKLGADMENGQNKTIMTLFDYGERSMPIEMNRDAEAGTSITVNMWSKM
jgi:hypothetical protein